MLSMQTLVSFKGAVGTDRVLETVKAAHYAQTDTIPARDVGLTITLGNGDVHIGAFDGSGIPDLPLGDFHYASGRIISKATVEKIAQSGLFVSASPNKPYGAAGITAYRVV